VLGIGVDPGFGMRDRDSGFGIQDEGLGMSDSTVVVR